MRLGTTAVGRGPVLAVGLLCAGASLVACGQGTAGGEAATTGASTTPATTTSTITSTTTTTGTGEGGADAGPAEQPLHFVVYGDSRTDPAPHQQVVDAFAKVSPELVIATGDLWDGYGADTWRSIVTKNANIADLLTKNLFLVSRGNHETFAQVQAFSPTLVRDGAERYSFTLGDAFFVGLGMDPSAAVADLEAALDSDAAKHTRWRVVFSHDPIYSSGPHGADGVPSIESLCDKYGVALYFSGHDHIYERSHQMHGGQIVDQGDALAASKGVVYIVTGGGGAPLYATGKIASTHVTASALHYVDVTATAASLSVKVATPGGKTIDAFRITNGRPRRVRAAGAPAGRGTITRPAPPGSARAGRARRCRVAAAAAPPGPPHGASRSGARAR
jgi:hypothetical protein